ncbi:hypothetical protein DL98DRAFT_522688 [Cadophora sp. DSE1049]|nr:hypothetical protein DL98DRAFT_522688 [Cadophora sp. DSE1049]
MKFTKLVLAAGAFAVASALRFTNANYNNISVGIPFNITWADASGPVSLTLLVGGTPPFFNTAATIASGLTGTSFLWTPNASLLRNTYDIRFDDSKDSIHSFQFELLQAAVTATATTTVTSVATSTTSYATLYTYPM